MARTHSTMFSCSATATFVKGSKIATVTVKAPWVQAVSIIKATIDDASARVAEALTAGVMLNASNKVPGKGFDVICVSKSDFFGDLPIVCVST